MRECVARGRERAEARVVVGREEEGEVRVLRGGMCACVAGGASGPPSACSRSPIRTVMSTRDFRVEGTWWGSVWRNLRP